MKQGILKPGDRVRLLVSVKRQPVPEGRQDFRSATIRAMGTDGAVHLDRDLNGMRWWNVSDLQRVGVRPKRN